MNFRNKYLMRTIRTLLALLLLFSGISGLMMGSSTEGVPENLIPMTQALYQSGIFHMIKVTEIVTGLMFLFAFLPALAAVMVAPLGVGIIVVNSVLMPQFLPFGSLVAIFTAYLGYYHWDKYKALFAR